MVIACRRNTQPLLHLDATARLMTRHKTRTKGIAKPLCIFARRRIDVLRKGACCGNKHDRHEVKRCVAHGDPLAV